MNHDSHMKYPRTFHLPYSLTITDDDKRLESDEQFKGMEVVVTEKMDGENTTVYSDGYVHARSLDGANHPWQSWVKGYSSTWFYNIPIGWRVCGENLYPRHSIAYEFDNEKKFFQVFGIYDENNICLSWEDVCAWCMELGIEHVPVIYRGVYDKDAILSAFEHYKSNGKNEVEGFVVRNSGSFHYDFFKANVGKYVRANHVTTDEHWTRNWSKNKIVK